MVQYHNDGDEPFIQPFSIPPKPSGNSSRSASRFYKKVQIVTVANRAVESLNRLYAVPIGRTSDEDKIRTSLLVDSFIAATHGHSSILNNAQHSRARQFIYAASALFVHRLSSELRGGDGRFESIGQYGTP
jgi:hypothetical protein